MQDLGVLNGGQFSIAYSISDAGEVTGQSLDSVGNSFPFLWIQSTGMTALPMLPGATCGFAGSMTSHGTIRSQGCIGCDPCWK
jgi:uncharacterized membrane protein